MGQIWPWDPSWDPRMAIWDPPWPMDPPWTPLWALWTPLWDPLKREILGFSREMPFSGGSRGGLYGPWDPLWDPPPGALGPPLGPP